MAFRPKEDVEATYVKVSNYYKKFSELYDIISKEFENLFLKKLNLDYWNTNSIIKEDNSKKVSTLELNKKLETHDIICDKFVENITSFSDFCKGLSEIE